VHFLKKIRSFFGLRQKADLSALIDALEREGGVRTSFRSFVNDGYKKNGTVYGAINLIALNAAAVPWVSYRTKQNDERDELPRAHPLNQLLRRPNPKYGGARFFEQLVTYMHVSGKAFVQKIMVNGRTRELWNLRPDAMELRKKDDPDSGWSYKPDPSKTPQLFEPEEILALYLLDPSTELDGLSPIEVAATTINQANFSREWNQAILENSGRPPGIIRSEDGLPVSDQSKREILNKFSDLYGGYKNAGRPIVLEGKLSWQRTGFTPGELEWLDGQRVADRNTAFTLGVPSVLTGDTELSTYSNYQEARKSLYQDKVIPLLEWLRDELNVWLAPDFGNDVELDINLDNVDALQEDRKDQWERVGKASWLTLNEQREATGYESIGPTGDIVVTGRGVLVSQEQVLIPATLLPIDSAGADNDDDKAGYIRFVTKEESTTEKLPPTDPCCCYDEDEGSVDLLLAGVKQQSTSVQSLIFAKKVFKAAESAQKWAKEHGFKFEKVDETENSWRLRQFEPAKCRQGSFRTISLARGVNAAICRKKGKKEDEPEPTLCFFNCPAERKTGHWKVVEREREPFYRLAKLRTLKRFSEERQAILKALNATGIRDVDILADAIQAALEEGTQAWEKLYDQLYLTVGEHFARRVLSAVPELASLNDWAIAAATCPDWKREPDEFYDPFAHEVRRYLLTQSSRKIKGIQESTLRSVRAELIRGVDSGEGIDKLSPRVGKFLEKLYPHRAEVVARTEVLTASNLASDIAARSTGVANRKEWIATRDERTRDTHTSVDAQIVPMDEAFQVGGSQMMFPGDSSMNAPAEEIIQCRCAVGYVTE
jgi:HK97 family phage portal protein